MRYGKMDDPRTTKTQLVKKAEKPIRAEVS
jgi:hypothetical protein